MEASAAAPGVGKGIKIQQYGQAPYGYGNYKQEHERRRVEDTTLQHEQHGGGQRNDRSYQ